ncbi:MAG: CPBP family intramembrane metalloprotease [Flavobacteriales bacterium]|nr:CPBP family intramembrane metalloprotease [Flavobacteriales bacterium]
MLLLIFTGAALASFVGFVIAEVFLDIPLLTDPSLLDDLSNPELVPALRVMQVLQAVGMLILPAIIYLRISSSESEVKMLFRSPQRQPIMIGVSVFLVAFPFINYLAQWNAGIELPTDIGDWMRAKEETAGALTQSFLDMPNIGFLLFNLFMIAVLPAVGEELIFRGIIQRGLGRQFRNPHVAIWLAAIIFSAIHMQFFGFVPRMLMGVAMGYLFYWSGNLWYPTIAHFTNNAMAVILSYGIQHGSIRPEIESMGIENITVAGFSLVGCFMLLYLFKQQQAVGSQ